MTPARILALLVVLATSAEAMPVQPVFQQRETVPFSPTVSESTRAAAIPQGEMLFVDGPTAAGKGRYIEFRWKRESLWFDTGERWPHTGQVVSDTTDFGALVRVEWEALPRARQASGAGVSYFVVVKGYAREVLTLVSPGADLPSEYQQGETVYLFQAGVGDDPGHAFAIPLRTGAAAEELKVSEPANFDGKFILSDDRVNLRSAPSLQASVIALLREGQDVKNQIRVFVPGVVQGRPGFWVRVSYAGRAGWIWSAYLTPVHWWYLPPPRDVSEIYYSPTTSEQGRPPYQLAEVRAFLASVETKDLAAIEALFHKDFPFWLPISIPDPKNLSARQPGGGFKYRLFELGLMGDDSDYMTRFFDLVMKYRKHLPLGDVHWNDRWPNWGLFRDANPLTVAVLQKNWAAVDALLAVLPELATRIIENSNYSLVLPPIVTAVVEGDIELTGHLLDKGFPPDWTWDNWGERAVAPGAFPANLVTWSPSAAMTEFLLSRGVPERFRFATLFPMKIAEGTVLRGENGSITLKSETLVAIVGSTGPAEYGEAGSPTPQHGAYRTLLATFDGVTYTVNSRSISDYGSFFDH